ncbi:uncharacterized protein LOC128965451 [Oppia nitens]|uniref:uncharacterized protein LOC128965451 n=1 Tax=Oppia nitens TaxID=1686743 RepID=UPI0023DCC19B|nr:uncharacterized protein LOC128965451 [Oppia nitens]
MSESYAKGDTNECLSDSTAKDTLIRLRNNKKLLTNKLCQTAAKSIQMQKQMEMRKSKVMQLMDNNNKIVQQLSHIKIQSDNLEEKTQKVESLIDRSRRSIEELSHELAEKRLQQSLAVEQITEDMHDLAKQMTNLSLLHSKQKDSREICDQIVAIDAQNQHNYDKRMALMKQLQKLNDEYEYYLSGRSMDNGYGGQYNWSDWPLEHRRLSVQIFTDENRLYAEDIEFLNSLG